MRKNRLLMSLMFALTSGAVACGGADDSVTDSTESLRRGHSDGGEATSSGRHHHDGDADVDEDSDESGDGGKHHGRVEHERGDGGTCRGHGERGSRGGDDDGKGGGKDDGKGGGKDDGKDDHEDGKGGLGGPHLDGGVKHEGKGHDASAP